MVRKSELPKARYHVMLFVEDYEFLEQEYGKNGPKPVGVSAAISAIIHAKVLDLKARAAEAYEALAAQEARASQRQLLQAGAQASEGDDNV